MKARLKPRKKPITVVEQVSNQKREFPNQKEEPETIERDLQSVSRLRPCSNSDFQRTVTYSNWNLSLFGLIATNSLLAYSNDFPGKPGQAE